MRWKSRWREPVGRPEARLPARRRPIRRSSLFARRRQTSPSEKRRIVAAAGRCTQPGEIGALLRREGIYSSQLATWRKNLAAATAGAERKRGRKADPAVAEAHRTAKLTREDERLRRQLAQARLIIDVQKKVSSLLALQAADETDGESAWTA